MRRLLLLLLPTALLALASPAAAQPQVGVLGDPIHDGEDAQAIRVMHAFARCTIRRRRGPVLRFLAAEPGSAEARRNMSRAMDEMCLEDAESMRLSGPLARGMLYEAVYRRDFADPPPADLGAAPPLPYPEVRSTAAGVRISQTALFRLGECVVRAAPLEAHRLLHTEPTESGEAEAFATLLPRFSACLPAGDRTHFSAPILRGALAEALFRLRTAGRQP